MWQTTLEAIEVLMSYQRMDVFLDNLSKRKKTEMAFLMWLSNLGKNAGVDIHPGAWKVAMRQAGESGKYASPMDAANDQDTWANAYEISQDGWENHAKGVKRYFPEAREDDAKKFR